MLLDISFLDDSTRPKAPELGPLAPHQRAAGQHLKDVHDNLRRNTKALRTMIDEIMAGQKTATDVERETEAMTMVHNFRRFGNLCGQHCQIVHGHHTLEDRALFPALSAKGEAWKKVVDRLVAEHEVVHALLLKMIDALNVLAKDPSEVNFANAVEVNDALERVLLSHLGYEEEAIGDALGFFRIM